MLHCGFIACEWHLTEDAIHFHLDMERLLYCHLYKKHKDSQMAMVPDFEWDDEAAIAAALDPEDPEAPPRTIRRHMNALAYYTAAVCLKEQMHIPIIGPSVDRRMLTLLTRLCNSDTIHALVCVACGQIHTSVKSWTKAWPDGVWRQAQTRDLGLQGHRARGLFTPKSKSWTNNIYVRKSKKTEITAAAAAACVCWW